MKLALKDLCRYVPGLPSEANEIIGHTHRYLASRQMYSCLTTVMQLQSQKIHIHPVPKPAGTGIHMVLYGLRPSLYTLRCLSHFLLLEIRGLTKARELERMLF